MSAFFSPEYRIFVDCLKTLRIESQFTQRELAELLGVKQSVVSKYEHNQKRLDIIEIRRICQALDVSFPQFVEKLENKLREKGY